MILWIESTDPSLFTSFAKLTSMSEFASTFQMDSRLDKNGAFGHANISDQLEERMAHFVIDTVPALLSYIDASSRYRFCNRAYTEWFGLPHDKIIGKTMLEVLGRDALQVLQPFVDEVLSGRRTEFEVEAKYKAAGTRWIRVNYTPDIDITGKILGFAVLVTDIGASRRAADALRESEQFSRTMIESSRDSITLLTLDGTLLWMSHSALQHLCIDAPETCLGKSWLNFWQGADRANAQNAVNAAASGGSGTFLGQRIVGNQRRWWEVVISPIRDAVGRPEKLLAIARDVTERKASEDILKRSEALLQKALAAKTVGVLFFNLRGRITNANTAIEQMTGYTRDELENSVHWQLLTAEPFLGITAQTARSLAERGEATPYEKQMIRKDGSMWWGLFAPTRLVDNGLDSECMEFNIDITQHKHAEAALRESEKRFRSFVEATAHVIWRTNREGAVDRPIPSWYAFTGQTEHEAAGFGWMDAIYPEDQPKVIAAWQKASPAKATYEVEYRIKVRSGEWRHVLARGVPVLDQDGNVMEYVGTCIDVTARKLTEAALAEREAVLRTVTNEERVGLVMVDEERRYLFVNQTYTEILGLRDEAIVGKRVPEVLPELYHQIKPHFDKALTGERVTYELRMPRHPRTGAERIYEVTYEPRLNNGQRYLVVVIVDITERKKAQALLEQTVNERTAALLQANKQMEAFTYTIAHDLRSPLRAQQSFATALIEDYGRVLDDTGRDYAERIIASATRLNQLVNDLLAYSRIDRADMTFGRLNLHSVISDVCSEMTFQIHEARAKIHLEQLQFTVCGHEPTFRTAVTNLISNAIKFSKPGVPPEVGISAERRAPWIRILVEDNGIGIAPEYHHQIFGVFHRLHKAGDYPGTGVGLAIVQKGVERMGGRVGVESAEGQGSRFWIELENAD
jgi:PAS domain S-box-containing protein